MKDWLDECSRRKCMECRNKMSPETDHHDNGPVDFCIDGKCPIQYVKLDVAGTIIKVVRWSESSTSYAIKHFPTDGWLWCSDYKEAI